MPHLLSETLVWCVTLLLFGMGLIGTLIPMLPGIIIIAAGCVWQGAMGRENLAWWEWTVLALLVAGGMVIDKLSGGMGAKKFGSTAAGIWGAIIGAVAGSLLFSPIVGLLFMPFLGALLAELIFARKDIMDAFRAAARRRRSKIWPMNCTTARPTVSGAWGLPACCWNLPAAC